MADKSRKSNVVALLLCLLAGFLGAHRFYVGKIGSGVVQLLCCVLPVLMALYLKSGGSGDAVLPLAVVALASFGALIIWNLVDGIMIVMQKFSDSQGDVLKFK